MNSWINRRRAAVENLSRDNIFRMTSEEDALLSEGDNYWDLPRHNGRFIRVAIKRYDSGVFVYIKTFRMESGSGNDDVKWYRVNQLSVSMDELIALSALFGSLPDDQLSKEERKKRVEFESIIQKYVDPMNTRSLVPEKKSTNACVPLSSDDDEEPPRKKAGSHDLFEDGEVAVEQSQTTIVIDENSGMKAMKAKKKNVPHKKF